MSRTACAACALRRAGALRGAGALALLLAAASGCTGLFHSTLAPDQIYYLRAPGAPGEGAAAPASGAGAGGVAAGSAGASASSATPEGSDATPPASLRVGHPIAAPGLDSPRIALVQPDHRMNFYAASRWPTPVPDMIEALAVETLRDSGEWASVEDSASPFPADFLLQLAVRRFEAEYAAAGAPPVVHVVLESILGRREGGDVVATFTAAASAPAAANRMRDVIAAFEQANSQALTELSQDAVRAVRSAARPSAQNGASPAVSSSRPAQ